MTTTHLQESRCPACRKALDAATAIDAPTAKPKPGDVSLCFGCGTVLVFTKKLGHRVAGKRDLLGLTKTQLAALRRTQVSILMLGDVGGHA